MENKMKNNIIHSALYILIIICFYNNVFAQKYSVDELRVKIDKANEILDEASKKYDYETMALYYEDDVIVLPNGEPLIQGKKAFLENEKKAEQAGYKILGIETTNVDLFYCDDYVHEVGKYNITLKVPNVPFDIIDKGKYLIVWKIHSDGSIKIKLETWNNDEIQR